MHKAFPTSWCKLNSFFFLNLLILLIIAVLLRICNSTITMLWKVPLNSKGGKKFHFPMTFNACSGFFWLYIYPHECVCTSVWFIHTQGVITLWIPDGLWFVEFMSFKGAFLERQLRVGSKRLIGCHRKIFKYQTCF